MLLLPRKCEWQCCNQGVSSLATAPIVMTRPPPATQAPVTRTWSCCYAFVLGTTSNRQCDVEVPGYTIRECMMCAWLHQRDGNLAIARRNS